MLYTAILQSSSIIADYSDDVGDYPSMIKTILRANRQPINFYVIPYLGYDYYFLHQDNMTFTSITPINQNNEKVLLYLQKLKGQFMPLYQKEKEKLTYRTVSLIKTLMIEYNNALPENKLQQVDETLEVIVREKQEQMRNTLEKDNLLNKTKEKSDSLRVTSFEMHNTIQKKLISNKRRYRCYFIIGGIIVFCALVYYYLHYYHWKKF